VSIDRKELFEKRRKFSKNLYIENLAALVLWWLSREDDPFRLPSAYEIEGILVEFGLSRERFEIILKDEGGILAVREKVKIFLGEEDLGVS